MSFLRVHSYLGVSNLPRVEIPNRQRNKHVINNQAVASLENHLLSMMMHTVVQKKFFLTLVSVLSHLIVYHLTGARTYQRV